MAQEIAAQRIAGADRERRSRLAGLDIVGELLQHGGRLLVAAHPDQRQRRAMTRAAAAAGLLPGDGLVIGLGRRARRKLNAGLIAVFLLAGAGGQDGESHGNACTHESRAGRPSQTHTQVFRLRKDPGYFTA